MSGKRSPEQLVKQFGSEARRGKGVAARLQRAVDSYFEEPSRRDARGRTAAELDKVGKTLRQLIRAIGWQDHPDPIVNGEAKALVRTTAHAQDPFEKLMPRASKLEGSVRKSGRRRKAQQPIAGCEPLRMALPQGFSVERLDTVARLASAGRTFGNCAKDNGHGEHDRLRRREADFYLVQRDGATVAMFDVDLASSKIEQFVGRRDEDPELPRSVLVAMLSSLRLNGDEVRGCLHHGVLFIFVSGEADRAKPHFSRRGLRVWYGRKRIAVCERGARGERWSSFTWEGDDWDSTYGSERHSLAGLMTHHPEIAVIAREAAGIGTRRRRGRPAPGKGQPASR